MRQPTSIRMPECATYRGTELHSEQPRYPGHGLGDQTAAPVMLLSLFEREDRGSDQPAAETAQRFRRHRGDAPLDQRQARPFVVGAGTSEARICPPSQDGPTPWPEYPRRSGSGSTGPCRRTAGGRPRRRSGHPTPLDLHVGERGKQPTEPLFGARSRGSVVGEALVDAAAEADRAGARSPSARGRRSSCGSSGGTCARRRCRAAGPADLLEQFGHRLGEHDVRAEDRQPAAQPAASR